VWQRTLKKKIAHFEKKNPSKFVTFGTKSTHFEIKKKNSTWAMSVDQYCFHTTTRNTLWKKNKSFLTCLTRSQNVLLCYITLYTHTGCFTIYVTRLTNVTGISDQV
jgi:hypothetical protein